MEADTFIQKITADLNFAAQTYADLRLRPKAFGQVVAHPKVAQKLIQDPVFFAVLMCGDQWLINAPQHQKLLRDLSQRQVAVCGRGWGKS
jgi:hypothetical protein